MRTIKFRAWHVDGECILFVGDDNGTTHDLDCCAYAIQGQPVILDQFTGLLDKNGKEIYEGDVLYFDGYQSQVVFKVVNARFESVETNNGRHRLLAHRFKVCEVVGNIHQNPELVES